MARELIRKDFEVFLDNVSRRRWALGYLLTLTCSSTIIFSYVEKHGLFDSLYWTITVLTTVGFGDITPHTFPGKLLFLFDAISGITTYVYLITSWQSSIVEARLERKLWQIAETDFKDKSPERTRGSTAGETKRQHRGRGRAKRGSAYVRQWSNS